MVDNTVYIIYREDNIGRAFISEPVVLGFMYNEDEAIEYVKRCNEVETMTSFYYYEPVQRILTKI